MRFIFSPAFIVSEVDVNPVADVTNKCLRELCEKGIPTIGLGPSREDLAHMVDEYVELTQLYGAVECYYAVMEALLL